MLKQKRVAILATDGYEQSELTRPLEALRDAGADVKVVSLDAEPIRGVRGKDWADRVDEEVVVHNGLVTSRSPADLEAFCAKLIEEIGEGLHEQRAASVG